MRQQATSGVIWSAFERFGQQGCAFIVQLVLARLLAPEQFGLIAMVVVFIVISRVVVNAGFSQAIVQQKTVSAVDLSTVFYTNMVIALLMALLLCGVAPMIAIFYEQPLLVPILRWLSLSLIFGALGGVHQALIQRAMDFKKLCYVGLPTTFLAGSVSIYLAWNGAGVWALVVYQILGAVLSSAFLFVVSGWRPQLLFCFGSLARIFPFGWRLAVSGVLDQVFQNIYVLVIGKCYLPIEVGYYQRAKGFQQLPMTNMQAILGRIAFPLFSTLQDEPERMRRGLSKAVQLGALIAFPLMAVMYVVAEPMIVLLIGDKWLPSAEYLKLLCIVGALYPLHALNLSALMGLGRSDLFLRLEIIKKVMVLVNILLTYRIGITAMIYGMIITSFLALFLNTYFSGRFIGYTFGQQIRDVLPIALLALVIWAVAGFVLSLFPIFDLIGLVSSLMAAIFVFTFGLRAVALGVHGELRTVLSRVPCGSWLGRLIFSR
ncbi:MULTISPECIES: lipopolysaccharide biosynthesis protein [unclassified Lentimonas]|uniref:lipopolysaccharide biosynthesis protein n=1 Tax=unclassified Lentimonas TaxID=2630993 RepID=UPI0013894D2E|nr:MULTISPECIES: lipopolysaccharide biosynthesis protein [unclassified Lentimonas]